MKKEDWKEFFKRLNDARACDVCHKIYHPIQDIIEQRYPTTNINAEITGHQEYPVNICPECWIRGEKKHVISWEGTE